MLRDERGLPPRPVETRRLQTPNAACRVDGCASGATEEMCGHRLLAGDDTFERGYELLDRLRRLSHRRTARCRRLRLNESVQVIGNDAGAAWVAGVETCNNVWGCPVCAARIQARRADLVDYVIDHWIGMHATIGPSTAAAYLMTATIRHRVGHDLKSALDLVSSAWSLLFAGRRGQLLRSRIGIRHFVRSVEITYGANGWHPHLHCVLLTDGPLGKTQMLALNEAWQTCVRSLSLDESTVPSDERGCVLRRLHASIEGRYVTKLFLELTDIAKGGRSGNLSWWQLADAATRDAKYAALWQTAQDAVFRRKQLTWSIGTGEAFGVHDLIAADDDGTEPDHRESRLLIDIPGKVWDEAWRRDPMLLSRLLPVAAELAATGDYRGVLRLARPELDRYGGGAPCRRSSEHAASSVNAASSSPLMRILIP